jgi:predicted hydrocarbon binding protein
MMFQMGKDVGSHEARKILQGLDDAEADQETIMERILEEVSSHGWGDLRLKEFDLVEGVVEVVLQHNVFEAHCEEIDMPQCFFLRGYLAGIIEELTEQRLHFKESKCYAFGDKDCSIKMVKS